MDRRKSLHQISRGQPDELRTARTDAENNPEHRDRSDVLVLLAGVFLGVSVLWQSQLGASKASAADCRKAQKLIDDSQDVPIKKAEREACHVTYGAEWETLEEGYLQNSVAQDVEVHYKRAAGGTFPLTQKEFDDVVDGANS
ncbi:hypothetical protein GCM10022223_33150 [Kineosporia mesophila]|uniref:Uncharacterized protein n=1 Tax=Kineosporia mesophila TaxID=566012 RepID=A0ABP6ZPK5_9ACTN|nr:hypothetical protein [Kineosporia mesophila]MCD5353692.1 hypothetical protein [Kineosporia mesophila]